MKDRILNICMLLTVAAALILSFLKGTPEPEMNGISMAWTDLPTAVPTASPSPAEAYRQHRAQTRAEEQIALQALIENAQTNPDIRVLAEKQIMETARNDEIELTVEAALAAKGWNEGLCTVRQGTVTVFFPQEISEKEAALLLDVIQEASGLNAENIRMTGF